MEVGPPFYPSKTTREVEQSISIKRHFCKVALLRAIDRGVWPNILPLLGYPGSGESIS